MAKKSFFERLTGATKGEVFKEAPDEKINSLKKFDFEKPRKTSSKTKKENKTTKEKMKSEEQPTPKEEWSSDEEGQLQIDVYQTENDIVIKSMIAGVKSEDIDVAITNDMITIKGVRRKDETIPQENYDYQELYWGPFSRSVILPIDVDSDKAKASVKDGILTIKLPKTEKLKTKTITVKEIE